MVFLLFNSKKKVQEGEPGNDFPTKRKASLFLVNNNIPGLDGVVSPEDTLPSANGKMKDDEQLHKKIVLPKWQINMHILVRITSVIIDVSLDPFNPFRLPNTPGNCCRS